ncbi:MAG: hypothetical protein Q8K18_09280 [Burkholderiales bacterium]|nr:hypothetical protein [Burkholderiales bacterium]
MPCMQVTFVPASMSFDTQSIFINRPVAAAPIHCDQLTLRVPVRGAKFGRWLVVCFMLLAVMSLTGKPSFAAEPPGRFFFTPEQRTQLDIARKQKSRVTLASEIEENAAPAAEILTLGGSVRRSDGKSTVWLNNRAVNDREAPGGIVIDQRLRPNGAVTIQVPQSARSIELKVGQSVDIVSGVIEEPFARQVTAPKPAAAESAAGKPVPGKPPAPGEKAAATALTPEQKERGAELEAALERQRDTRPGAKTNAPDRR